MPDLGGALAAVFPAGARAAAVRCVVPSASERRAQTFSAGRSAATAALGRDDVVIGRDDDGVPVWPAGVVGSIAHTDRWAVAVVMEGAAGIGVDVEDAGAVGPAERPVVLTQTEASTYDGDATVVFCAKEATYKALFPRDRRLLDFHDVEVDVVPDGCFTATVIATGERVAGRWAVADGVVLAGAVLAAA